MLLGDISLEDTYAQYLNHPVWIEALDWIRNNAADAPGGVYPLRGQSMFVNVHGYDTIDIKDARFERHRRYIDLQYCIRGGEDVLWRPAEEASELIQYNEEKDVAHSPVVPPWSRLSLSSGLFVIFFPNDEHAPKINNGLERDVWKLVVKVECALLR